MDNMSRKRVSIVTVNYNQPAITIDFLKSVEANTATNDIEVILVDNGCMEDYEKTFRAVCPRLIYIRSDENLGFAGGNNLGVKVATGEFILFLNNDTELTENVVDVLASELEHNPQIGLISPLILFFDDPAIIQYAGFTPMNYLTCRNKAVGYKEENLGQYADSSKETGYCHGAAMMCRRKDIETVGLMKEQYFLYYEELDWCESFLRTGKKIWFTGRVSILHKESMSVGKESIIKTYFMTRNRMLFIRRNTGQLNTLFFSIYFVFVACTRQIISYLIQGRIDLVKYVFKGIYWNVRHGKDSCILGFKVRK